MIITFRWHFDQTAFFYSRKCTWKWLLQISSHFDQVSECGWSRCTLSRIRGVNCHTLRFFNSDTRYSVYAYYLQTLCVVSPLSKPWYRLHAKPFINLTVNFAFSHSEIYAKYTLNEQIYENVWHFQIIYDIIGSDNGLLPGRHQAIIWTNTGLFFTFFRHVITYAYVSETIAREEHCGVKLCLMAQRPVENLRGSKKNIQQE